MKMNLSPSTGSKELCSFAHMEKESGKAHQKGTTACLGALWENGRTMLQQKQLSRCLQVDFRAMTKKPTSLGQKERKSL